VRLIILLVTLLATNPIFAKKLTLDSEIFNMSDQQWSNLEKSLATAEIPSSFIEEKCFDHHINTLHERYAVSFDGEGHLCRVYDLTFPHLKLLFSGKNSLASIPAQKYTASDFLNWIDGNYDLVYERVSNFQQQEVNLKHQQVASWIKDIRFKKGSAAYANFTNSDEMPASFYASDINFGRDLKFNKFRQGQLKRILVALANSGTGINNLDQWANIIDNPQNLLEKIRFDWNSVKKVYDIALEGQFLPINGPIALINFDRPHKVFVEGILRRVVQMAMGQVLKTVGGAPGVVVAFAMNEVFLGLDNAYAYQMTRLEASLKDTLESGSLVMSNGQAKRGV